MLFSLLDLSPEVVALRHVLARRASELITRLSWGISFYQRPELGRILAFIKCSNGRRRVAVGDRGSSAPLRGRPLVALVRRAVAAPPRSAERLRWHHWAKSHDWEGSIPVGGTPPTILLAVAVAVLLTPFLHLFSRALPRPDPSFFWSFFPPFTIVNLFFPGPHGCCSSTTAPEASCPLSERPFPFPSLLSRCFFFPALSVHLLSSTS